MASLFAVPKRPYSKVSARVICLLLTITSPLNTNAEKQSSLKLITFDSNQILFWNLLKMFLTIFSIFTAAWNENSQIVSAVFGCQIIFLGGTFSSKNPPIRLRSSVADLTKFAQANLQRNFFHAWQPILKHSSQLTSLHLNLVWKDLKYRQQWR